MDCETNHGEWLPLYSWNELDAAKETWQAIVNVKINDPKLDVSFALKKLYAGKLPNKNDLTTSKSLALVDLRVEMHMSMPVTRQQTSATAYQAV